MGGRIQERMFLGKLCLFSLLLLILHLSSHRKVKGEEESERTFQAEKTPAANGSMTKGQGEYERMLDRLDKVFQVMVEFFYLFVCF